MLTSNAEINNELSIKDYILQIPQRTSKHAVLADLECMKKGHCIQLKLFLWELQLLFENPLNSSASVPQKDQNPLKDHWKNI